MKKSAQPGRHPSGIFCFGFDLRLADNPALVEALETCEKLVLVYVHAPEEEGQWALGAASRWWLHQSLIQLDESLAARGAKLHLVRAKSRLVALKQLIKQTKATYVGWNENLEGHLKTRDAEIERELGQMQVTVKTAGGRLLVQPAAVRNGKGEPYKVFGAFYKKILADQSSITPELAAPKKIVSLSVPADKLADFDLLPKIDWLAGIEARWQPGEKAARVRLKKFLVKQVAIYREGRDAPALDGTSSLSPYLRFGEISPRQIWWAVKNESAHGRPSDNANFFLRELMWREFSYHLLDAFPQTPTKSLRPEFDTFKWKSSPAKLKLWERGLTGYPIVDAGIRQLWKTGWMHNRVRMIVGSFLIKDLLIDWRLGAAWFWDTLVDADLANNTMGWQWVAGSGADASPFFRVFNPTLQGQKFDPKGEYVRTYVPELTKLPNAWIHRPFEAEPEVLAKAGIELGVTYPHPIVNHVEARDAALAAFRQLKKGARKIG